MDFTITHLINVSLVLLVRSCYRLSFGNPYTGLHFGEPIIFQTILFLYTKRVNIIIANMYKSFKWNVM